MRSIASKSRLSKVAIMSSGYPRAKSLKEGSVFASHWDHNSIHTGCAFLCIAFPAINRPIRQSKMMYQMNSEICAAVSMPVALSINAREIMFEYVHGGRFSEDFVATCNFKIVNNRQQSLVLNNRVVISTERCALTVSDDGWASSSIVFNDCEGDADFAAWLTAVST